MNDLLGKAATQKFLTEDTVELQFCSDWLKDQIKELFVQLRKTKKQWSRQAHYSIIDFLHYDSTVRRYREALEDLRDWDSDGRLRPIVDRVLTDKNDSIYTKLPWKPGYMTDKVTDKTNDEYARVLRIVRQWNMHWLLREPGYHERARLCDANMAHHLAKLLTEKS